MQEQGKDSDQKAGQEFKLSGQIFFDPVSSWISLAHKNAFLKL